MKRKPYLLIAMSAFALAAIGAVFVCSGSFDLARTHASGLSYGVTFNQNKNKFHSYSAAREGEATVKTDLANDIKFSYSGLKGSGSAWQVLGSGGSFHNVDPIHGIESITLSFNTNGGAFSIYYSGGNLFDRHQSFVSSTSQITSFDFGGFRPNYFKVVNEGGLDLSIAAIGITLSCTDGHATQNGAVPVVSEDGKTIAYGLYPQTHVGDADLIGCLNQLGPSSIGANGWYSYQGSYYAKVVAKPYFYSLVYSDGSPVTEGETAWFKCEPISWRVLSSDDGYFLLSALTLDNMYYTTHASSYEDEEGKYVSISNYYHSDLRAWLNDGFLNSAFALNDEYVATTTVDNGFDTCNGKNTWNASPDTEDKVFLPSYKDMVTSAYGFPGSEGASDSRASKATDYAMAKYTYAYEGEAYLHNSIYWTRSPDSEYRVYVSSVRWDGKVDSEHATKNEGVRPCITLNLDGE